MAVAPQFEFPAQMRELLAKAKDFPEMLEIQGRHAQRQMATYSTQAQELGRLMAGAVKSDHTR
jgi:hypothetical protein